MPSSLPYAHSAFWYLNPGFNENLAFLANLAPMVTPRLPFLWPTLFKSLAAPRSAARIHCNSSLPRTFTTSTFQAREQGLVKRYGKAQEPAPHLCEQEATKTGNRPANTESSGNFPDVVKSDVRKNTPEPGEEEEEEEEEELLMHMPATLSSHSTISAVNSSPHAPALESPRVGDSKPLDTVLEMASPAEEEQRKPPHLKTPPYVHHFDTYGLVKDLANSGFTQEQAVTVMKAVRGILLDNMELARQGLVSKSNVENETYLFRAACSELRTEIGNSRKAETEKMRTERTQVQHELDILNQKLAQEATSLKDELKGLFDDRKMAVRQEQRIMDGKVYFLRNQYVLWTKFVIDPGTQLQDHCSAQLGCT